MRSVFTLFLVASIIGIAVFGAFGMNHESGHGIAQGNCIAATAKGTKCADNTKPLDAAAFHIGALKDFSLATFDASVVGGLLLIFASLLVAVFALFASTLFQSPQFAFSKQKVRDYSFVHHKQKLARWLAFHENSPSNF